MGEISWSFLVILPQPREVVVQLNVLSSPMVFAEGDKMGCGEECIVSTLIVNLHGLFA